MSRWEFWDEDARLAQEDAERANEEQKDFLAREEALTEFDEYVHSLSLEEAEACLEGLREYSKTFTKDMDIVQGWERYAEE